MKEIIKKAKFYCDVSFTSQSQAKRFSHCGRLGVHTQKRHKSVKITIMTKQGASSYNIQLN